MFLYLFLFILLVLFIEGFLKQIVDFVFFLCHFPGPSQSEAMARMPLQEAPPSFLPLAVAAASPDQVPLTPAMDASELLGCFEQVLKV